MTESRDSRKVMIVPCSGIGKTFGSVSREAAYYIVEDLRPEATQLMPLAMLVLGDESSRAATQDNPAITIDGCKLACAAKMVRQTGGEHRAGDRRAGCISPPQGHATRWHRRA